jgi:cell filamentation protein
MAGKFDLDHVRAIHRHVFQDVYDWAGELRTVEISKGNSPFARAAFVPSSLADLTHRLGKETSLEGLTQTALSSRLAYYLAELNAIHPFREGNGRTQREFIRELALHNGYTIEWQTVTKERMLSASIESFSTGKTNALNAILDETMRPATAEERMKGPRQKQSRRHGLGV